MVATVQIRRVRNLKQSPSGSNKVTDPVHYPTLVNKPGELVYLPKADLQVDKRYQRPVNDRSIQRIADNWNWIACGTLLVSSRPDGKYYIVDGQHRWEAAKKVTDVKDLACLAFEINDIKDEAAGFLASNTERQIPKLVDKFNALVTVGDQNAILVDTLLKQSGRKLGLRPEKEYISCLSAIFRCLRRNRSVFLKIWPLLLDLSKEEKLTNRVVTGLFYLEMKMPKGHSVTDSKLSEKLLQIGQINLNASIRAVAAIEGRSNERVCAQGIVRALNRGNRNPIHIDL